MANFRKDDGAITLSILDRLIDLDPRGTTESATSHQAGLRELKDAVRRDMEWLLNSRQNPDLDQEGFEEVQRSVYAYGLPDLTGLGANDPNEQARMKNAIERSIEYFEPRFFGVRVTTESVSSTDKQLRFRIEANLDIEPTPEPMVFDTVLEFGSGAFVITEK